MAKSLTGEVPRVPLSLAKTKINEALVKVYNETDWAFQTQYAGWLAPGQVANTGTYTVTPYQNTVTADAAATAALAALSGPPLLTTLQYRDPARAIYNIIGYDPANPPTTQFAVLTLDRPWMEPTSGPGQPYMIYQAYFPAPVGPPTDEFRKFVEVRDTTNDRPLDFWSMSEMDLANEDPQRTDFSDPLFVVPCGFDNRPGSATLGWPMFELWPQQLSNVPYSFSFRRRGSILVNQSDMVPSPITEELLMWRAKEVLYQYKEAQKEKKEERGRDANWLLLAQAAKKEYDLLFDKLLPVNANLHHDFVTKVDRVTRNAMQPYSNRQGGLNIGGYPGYRR